MTPHIPEELSTRCEWRTFAIMHEAIPPRDPDEDEDDEEEDEDQAEEPPVVREPDED
jgi:hypothetical protein